MAIMHVKCLHMALCFVWSSVLVISSNAVEFGFPCLRDHLPFDPNVPATIVKELCDAATNSSLNPTSAFVNIIHPNQMRCASFIERNSKLKQLKLTSTLCAKGSCEDSGVCALSLLRISGIATSTIVNLCAGLCNVPSDPSDCVSKALKIGHNCDEVQKLCYGSANDAPSKCSKKLLRHFSAKMRSVICAGATNSLRPSCALQCIVKLDPQTCFDLCGRADTTSPVACISRAMSGSSTSMWPKQEILKLCKSSRNKYNIDCVNAFEFRFQNEIEQHRPSSTVVAKLCSKEGGKAAIRCVKLALKTFSLEPESVVSMCANATSDDPVSCAIAARQYRPSLNNTQLALLCTLTSQNQPLGPALCAAHIPTYIPDSHVVNLCAGAPSNQRGICFNDIQQVFGIEEAIEFCKRADREQDEIAPQVCVNKLSKTFSKDFIFKACSEKHRSFAATCGMHARSSNEGTLATVHVWWRRRGNDCKLL